MNHIRLALILMIVLFVIANCGQVTRQATLTVRPSPSITSSPYIIIHPSATIVPSPNSTNTPTPDVVQTLVAANTRQVNCYVPCGEITESPALLPILVTITPTFDLHSVLRWTAVPGNPCPVISAESTPTPVQDELNNRIASDDVLNFINTYGINALFLFYHNEIGGKSPIQDYNDFNNDGIPELAYGRLGSFMLIGCQQGSYQVLLKMDPDGHYNAPNIVQVNDLNRNGIPEITLRIRTMSQGGKAYTMIEWNGKGFQTVIKDVGVEATGNLGVEDVDNDGFMEYFFNIGIPVGDTYNLGVPWRQEKDYYRWNGNKFILFRRIFSSPEFRFQAVIDGDLATADHEYERALDLYHQVISDNHLQGWSESRRRFEIRAFLDELRGAPTSSLPAPDPLEYDNLAAYALYRIMLIQVAQESLNDANSTFQALQQKYSKEKPGHIYTRLGDAFWSEYSSSNNVEHACQKAIGFTIEHQDEVIPYIDGKTVLAPIDYRKNPWYICPLTKSPNTQWQEP